MNPKRPDSPDPDQIAAQAAANHLTQSKENDKETRETIQGLESIATSRVIDSDRVHAWLESWGSENELPPPIPEWQREELERRERDALENPTHEDDWEIVRERLRAQL